MNTTGGPDSSSQRPQREASHTDREGMQIHGRHGPSHYDHASSRQPAGSQRFPYSSTTTIHGENSSDSHECRSYWCLIRDILVCYAVLAVTYLLFQFWMLSADAFSPSDEEYDFVP